MYNPLMEKKQWDSIMQRDMPRDNSKENTSEVYDSGRYIVVQDGSLDSGNYYTAHCYFNSVGEWEIEETINTYLAR